MHVAKNEKLGNLVTSTTFLDDIVIKSLSTTEHIEIPANLSNLCTSILFITTIWNAAHKIRNIHANTDTTMPAAITRS